LYEGHVFLTIILNICKCRRERKDIIAIAVETGIQNTGKNLFLAKKVALKKSESI